MSYEENPEEARFLTVSCFGDFKAIVGEANIKVKWRTKKAQELFAYLVHLQGTPVERKNLISQLWPRAYPDNAVALLHNIIYSIRKELKLLGFKNLIHYRKGYYYLEMEFINSDLPSMLLLGQAVENEDEEIIKQHSNLLKYYKGAYFSDIESEWCNALREYFDNIYINGCKQIAEKNIKEKKYESAIHYLHQAQKADPFSESIAALLVQCYGKKRDFKNMKKYYERFMKSLKEELDLEASEILEKAFHESLH